MKSIVIEPRPALKATEARLEAIYKAAKRGLKGDSLAVTAGMLPEQYRRLSQNDPLVEFAEMRGRADGELEASEQLHAAAAQGDAKAAAFILTHAHGWVGKQQLQITQTTISITAALEQAQQRLRTIDEAPIRANEPGLLINHRNKDGDDYEDVNAIEAQRADPLRR